MAKRLSVVISQSPSKNPKKKKLEEDIVMGLMIESGIDVTVVPNLYDLKADGTGMLALKKLGGNMVVCSWLFERAAHWVLDRNQIHGHVGETLLKNKDEDDEEDSAEEEADDKERVIDQREIPDRKIYCLDFKTTTRANEYIEEIKRIHAENAVQVVGLGGSAPASNGASSNSLPVVAASAEPTEPVRIEETDGRRWYPVIDYSRCTNCMECIDFCLFGVYGVDRIDTILVEQPDNCRKGCPACSRVCPENAIMFPQHKTPAIAGSADAAASMKIDLSQLFGAPESNKSAEEIAALERDEQLVMAGRDAVGMSGLKKRQENRVSEPKDELDDLVDQLDDF
jgi:Pyruvate/2-oxoacid:ferredoxin oxidoreductase delta subunit